MSKRATVLGKHSAGAHRGCVCLARRLRSGLCICVVTLSVEGLLEVGDDVVGVFDADRESQ